VGTTEYEYVEAMGAKFVTRINQEFMKAGMRGLSLLFATGDRAVQVCVRACVSVSLCE